MSEAGSAKDSGSGYWLGGEVGAISGGGIGDAMMHAEMRCSWVGECCERN